MIVTELNIESFGPFWEARLNDLSRQLTVIQGPNEAGKSAIRAFVRMVLFGFLRENARERDLYNYPPAKGGAAGGGMSVRTASGGSFIIYRREGAHGGPVTVSGDETGDAGLLEALTGRISPEVYQSVFSISLTELQDFKSLERGQVSERIYSAGLGLGQISLPEVTRKLQVERSSSQGLWSQRSGRLRQSVQALSEKRAELARAREELAGYQELTRREYEVEDRVAEATKVLHDLRQDQERHQRLVEIRPHWERRSQMLAQLEELPEYGGFPRDGLTILEKLGHEVEDLTQQMTNGDRKRQARQTKAAQLQVVDAFSRNEAGIRRLLTEISHYRSAAEDLPRVRAELSEAQTHLRLGLEELGRAWTEEKLSEDLDVASLRKVLNARGKNLAEAREKRGTAAVVIQDRSKVESDAVDTLRQALDDRDSVEGVPPESARELGSTVETLERLRGALSDEANTRRELREVEIRLVDIRLRRQATSGARPPVWAAGAAIFLGIAVTFWGLASGEVSGIAAGSAMAVAGAALLAWSRRARQADASADGGFEPEKVLRGQRNDLTRRAQKGERELDGLMTSIDFPAAPTERDVVERLSDIQRRIRLREQYDHLSSEVTKAEERLGEARKRAVKASQAADTASSVADTAAADWKSTLERASLDPKMEPLVAAEALGQVQTLRERLAGVRSVRQRIKEMSDTIDDIESKLKPLLQEAGLPGFRAGARALSAMEDLEGRYLQHQSAAKECSSLQALDDEWKGQREQLADAREGVSRDRQQLLASAGASDEEAFRKLGDQLEERRRIEGDLKALHRDQPLLANQEGHQYRESLQSLSDEEVRTRRAELVDLIKGTGEALVQQQGDLRSLQDERVRMEESNPTAEIQLEIGKLDESVKEDARRWAVLTTAQELLEQTKAEFQRERQAPLLSTASSYFSAFTAGRYERVQAVLGEERVQVVEQRGSVKEVVALSRGTAEQLYLALRFALIDEYTRSSEPMPVLMDDVMVNFDPQRCRAVCDTVVGLSERHQVLVLTCHPETVSQLQEAALAAGAPDPAILRI